MGGPGEDLPLDLDSSPWRRWSPILLDVGVVLVSLHMIHALLIAYYPYGMMVGWYPSRGDALLSQLVALPFGTTGNWGGSIVGFGVLLVSRAGCGLLGWHRLIFCLVPPLLAVGWHFWLRSGSV